MSSRASTPTNCGISPTNAPTPPQRLKRLPLPARQPDTPTIIEHAPRTLTRPSEALQLAMDELDRLREGGRTVGLISHVSELRERIRTGIEVRPTDSGSTISVGAVSWL